MTRVQPNILIAGKRAVHVVFSCCNESLEAVQIPFILYLAKSHCSKVIIGINEFLFACFKHKLIQF